MCPERSAIENVVFDIGNVLVAINHRPFLAFLCESGVDLSDIYGWLARIGLDAHERGELDGEAFLERLAGTSARPLDRQRLRASWLDMFDETPEMFALATGLKAEYRVYLLSNIGDLHWTHLDARYGLAGLTHGALASCRAGVAKPSAAIYREAERRFGLEPARTVFIDDLEANVRGAESCGWRAIHHRDPATTRAALRALAVRLPAGFGGQ
jgi:putative hydrolase of the HAD superfamily